jgi:hypothetical protein
MSPKTHDDGAEATTYFQIQKNRAVNPGEEKVSSDISTLPPQPASSPWSEDPVPAEPTINREEDGDVMGTPIDNLP